MSEPVKSLPPVLKPCETLIQGKITAIRRHETKLYTTVMCPAVDEYSSPDIVEIRSDSPLGDLEQRVSCVARLGGYMGRPYVVTDKHTGVERKARDVRLTLDLVR